MHSRRCAMSLIEVTLVILVIGVLAAVAAPRFSDTLRVVRLEAAAKQLAAHIDYIRAVAINEGRTTTLACNNSQQSYGCSSVDFPERTGVLLQVSVDQEYDPTFKLNANFDSSTTLSFDFEGVPRVGASALANGKIVLRSGKQRFAVIVATGNGATRVVRLSDVGAGGGGDPDPFTEAPGAPT